MESLVYAAGASLIVIIVAILYYLGHESTYAFNRKFDYGFRFALQSEKPPEEADVSLDPNASLLTANKEGVDGLDEKEEGIMLPTLDQLSGAPGFGTGSSLKQTNENVNPDEIYRDDWRSQKQAGDGQKFYIYGFANADYREPNMALAWQPDASFNPKSSPFDFRLRLKIAPKGVQVSPIDIDLKSQPNGRIVVPTYIAKSDDDRVKGYVFEMEAVPRLSNAAATASGMATTKWDPTLSYPTFGIVPLLLGTGLITLIALCIAGPLGIFTALYMTEIASPRVREWMKPIIELLASVPTVVLAYLGLMLVAPALQKTFAQALNMESGRSLLTTSLIMALLLVPTITSIAEDSLRSIPNSLRAGGEALGLTKQETLKKIVLPAAKAGLIGAMMLGFARSIGETMIVWILSGGTPNMPTLNSVGDAAANLVRPTRGIADTVAIEMGNVDFEGVHYGHLFVLGLSLFLITLIINLAAQRMIRRSAWRA